MADNSGPTSARGTDEGRQPSQRGYPNNSIFNSNGTVRQHHDTVVAVSEPDSPPPLRRPTAAGSSSSTTTGDGRERKTAASADNLMDMKDRARAQRTLPSSSLSSSSTTTTPQKKKSSVAAATSLHSTTTPDWVRLKDPRTHEANKRNRKDIESHLHDSATTTAADEGANVNTGPNATSGTTAAVIASEGESNLQHARPVMIATAELVEEGDEILAVVRNPETTSTATSAGNARVSAAAGAGGVGSSGHEEEGHSSSKWSRNKRWTILLLMLLLFVGLVVAIFFAVTNNSSNKDDSAPGSSLPPTEWPTTPPARFPVETEPHTGIPTRVPSSTEHPTTIMSATATPSRMIPSSAPSPLTTAIGTRLCDPLYYIQDIYVTSTADLVPLNDFQRTTFQNIISSLTNQYDPVTGGINGTGGVRASTDVAVESVDSFGSQNTVSMGHSLAYLMTFCSYVVDPAQAGYHQAYQDYMSMDLYRDQLIPSIQQEMGLTSALAITIPAPVS